MALLEPTTSPPAFTSGCLALPNFSFLFLAEGLALSLWFPSSEASPNVGAGGDDAAALRFKAMLRRISSYYGMLL